MKAIIKKIANIFGSRTEVEILSMHDLVEKLEWAKDEVADTKDALLGLQFRLQNGVATMEEIEEDAQEVIRTHQAILEKAVARKNEFRGQVAQVEVAVNTVNAIYKD